MPSKSSKIEMARQLSKSMRPNMQYPMTSTYTADFKEPDSLPELPDPSGEAWSPKEDSKRIACGVVPNCCGPAYEDDGRFRCPTPEFMKDVKASQKEQYHHYYSPIVVDSSLAASGRMQSWTKVGGVPFPLHTDVGGLGHDKTLV